MRQHASQVPATISRLLQSTLLSSPPTWYLPVLANPPPVLPPRSLKSGAGVVHYSASREGKTKTHKMKHFRQPKPKAFTIVYEEDRIRRQFFKDFPFEALRPISLVEGRDLRPESEISGQDWTALEQRGRYPTVENCIAFTLNLHHSKKLPLSKAYEVATSEFIELRASHEMATIAAEIEARHHGATFKRSPFQRLHDLESRNLSKLSTSSASSSTATSISTKYRKPAIWTAAVPESSLPSGEFNRGQSYVKKWRLPAPVEMDIEGEGDLMEAIGSGKEEVAEQRLMSDEELLESVLRVKV
ncbi:small subunit ribosomal protein S23, partial [Tremellales sp. Uapishka_1]